jgi:NitT/TauT family transport system substrate-binding protein
MRMSALCRLFVSLGLCLTSCLALAEDGKGAKPAEKIVFLNYSVAPDLGDAPLWIVPYALGYFADEGLDVGIQQSGGSSASLQFLAAGRGQLASSTPDQIMLARQEGLKVTSFFEHNRAYGSALVVMAKSGIQTLDQLKGYLKGSAIGVASLSSGRVPYARSWIRELGLKEDQDVKLVAVGVGPQAAAALKTDRVRALVIYDAVYAAIEAETDVRFTRFEADWQKPLFSGVVATTESLLKEKPYLVARYGRALAKALVFSTTNPEAVVRIYWQLYPENKPAAAKEEDELKRSAVIVNSMVASWLSGMDQPGSKWGGQTAEAWKKLQDYDLKGGLISQADPVTDFFTDQFINKMNDFDVEAIKDQARNFNLSMIKYPAAK